MIAFAKSFWFGKSMLVDFYAFIGVKRGAPWWSVVKPAIDNKNRGFAGDVSIAGIRARKIIDDARFVLSHPTRERVYLQELLAQEKENVKHEGYDPFLSMEETFCQAQRNINTVFDTGRTIFDRNCNRGMELFDLMHLAIRDILAAWETGTVRSATSDKNLKYRQPIGGLHK